ncbi:hypothetical protein [Nocardia sp. NPDC004860]|uniref:hypothetical protein n=1 Tax=Nocardia sp. NPDC004860 TaxID=3154557 RepID=UPI0033ABDAAC
MIDRDTRQIQHALNIPDWAPRFNGILDTQSFDRFHDTECELCNRPGAVFVEYTVNDEVDGWIGTDAMYCAEHASDEVRCILDREDRSIDHDTLVWVNYWAIQYGAFGHAGNTIQAAA